MRLLVDGGPIIARRQSAHGSGLGPDRWVVEHTSAWLHNRRRVLIRTNRRDNRALGPFLEAASGRLGRFTDVAAQPAEDARPSGNGGAAGSLGGGADMGAVRTRSAGC